MQGRAGGGGGGVEAKSRWAHELFKPILNFLQDKERKLPRGGPAPLPTEEDRVAPIETRLGCWVGDWHTVRK